MDSFDIKKYLDMTVRRIYWVIIPFLVILLAGFYYILKTPKIYESTTLILVQAQKVPENYVRSTVTISVQDRLRTITQQVTSRSNLEKIIQEHHLYESHSEKDLFLEEKVEMIKKQIQITVANQSGGGESAFSISFQGKDPTKVMQVTNALASNFISENLKIRESQAFGTSDFLTNELQTVKNRLMEKEEQLKAYKEKYMGGLPEQLDSNLKILDRLQIQLDQLNSKLQVDEDKLTGFQQPVAPAVQVSTGSSSEMISMPSGNEDKLTALRNELESLQSRYTDNHPDIIQLKNKISALEQAQSAQTEVSTKDLSDRKKEQKTVPALTTINKKTRGQEVDLINEISRIKSDIKATETDIDWYQAKVRETPTRAQEMLSLNRDYNNINNQYNTLLNKELDSELSLSMEKKQQGEQFNIIDTAKVPVKPIKPNVLNLSLIILAIALGVGFGLSYMVDAMDTSFRGVEEIEKEFAIPILITMPTINTQMEVIKIKRKKIFAIASIAIGFIFCGVGVVFAAKGVDVTIGYLKNILGVI
jgi:polysaccharide chain length determinant protein (PEP-CTERM system associated)